MPARETAAFVSASDFCSELAGDSSSAAGFSVSRFSSSAVFSGGAAGLCDVSPSFADSGDAGSSPIPTPTFSPCAGDSLSCLERTISSRRIVSAGLSADSADAPPLFSAPSDAAASSFARRSASALARSSAAFFISMTAGRRRFFMSGISQSGSIYSIGVIRNVCGFISLSVADAAPINSPST